MENIFNSVNLACAVIIVVLFPFAKAMYNESKNVKNDYYKRKKESGIDLP